MRSAHRGGHPRDAGGSVSGIWPGGDERMTVWVCI